VNDFKSNHGPQNEINARTQETTFIVKIQVFDFKADGFIVKIERRFSSA